MPAKLEEVVITAVQRHAIRGSQEVSPAEGMLDTYLRRHIELFNQRNLPALIHTHAFDIAAQKVLLESIEPFAFVGPLPDPVLPADQGEISDSIGELGSW